MNAGHFMEVINYGLDGSGRRTVMNLDAVTSIDLAPQKRGGVDCYVLGLPPFNVFVSLKDLNRILSAVQIIR